MRTRILLAASFLQDLMDRFLVSLARRCAGGELEQSGGGRVPGCARRNGLSSRGPSGVKVRVRPRASRATRSSLTRLRGRCSGRSQATASPPATRGSSSTRSRSESPAGTARYGGIRASLRHQRRQEAGIARHGVGPQCVDPRLRRRLRRPADDERDHEARLPTSGRPSSPRARGRARGSGFNSVPSPGSRRIRGISEPPWPRSRWEQRPDTTRAGQTPCWRGEWI